MFGNIKADLKRLNPSGKASLRTLAAGLLSQGFQAILVYRMFNWLHRKGLPGQPLRFLLERFIEITTGISIPACCTIGRGFRIHHFGGIIFHPTVRIGANCTLYHGVTIGDRGGTGGAARIGDNVLIGAGAKIIGEITIGDNVIVGANAVVTKDVPADMVVTGSPACCRPRRKENRPDPAIISEPVRVMDFRGTYKGGGGPDKTILNSAVLHDPARVDVLVTYLRQPNDSEFQIPRMAAERSIKYTDLVDRSMMDMRCLLGLRRLIREHRIQVLHTRDDKTLLYGWLIKFFVPKLRLMHTCHSHAEYDREDFESTDAFWKFSLRKRFILFLIKRHQKPVLTVSENTRERLIRGGLKKNEVVALPNGIDTCFWKRDGVEPVLRKEFGLQSENILVGTVARITYDKDLPTFFEVARQVSEKIPEVVFAIVGDGNGDELQQARSEVERLGLGKRVLFTGHRNDLKEVYSSFDVFLMTSRTEGMPNTVLEAMSLQLPVVSTAIGGVPELVVDGETGILCPVGDTTTLAKAVASLVANEELRNSFGLAGRKRIEEHFDFVKRVKTMEEIYCSFADHKIGHRPPATGNRDFSEARSQEPDTSTERIYD